VQKEDGEEIEYKRPEFRGPPKGFGFGSGPITEAFKAGWGPSTDFND